MKKLILLFIIGTVQGFSQITLPLPKETAKSPILSHAALMDKVLKRSPKKEANPMKFKGFEPVNPTPFHKSAKLLAPTAYCNCQVALSVSSILLEAERQSIDSVALKWITEKEINSNGFEIERSFDATKFRFRGFLKSNNNSENKNEYQYIDENKHDGITYYRIKEIDLNGKVIYSKIVAVDGFPNENNIKIFPNPASDFVKLQIYSKKTGTGQLTLLSSIGKQISQQDISLAEGLNNMKFDIADIPAGVYFMKISIGNEKDKLIKFSKN